MTDNIARGQQAAQELVQRWIATMQSMAHQIQRQQQTFQQASQHSMELAIQQQQIEVLSNVVDWLPVTRLPFPRSLRPALHS
jgi:hypothetical protein